jgi:hypothetical protein
LDALFQTFPRELYGKKHYEGMLLSDLSVQITQWNGDDDVPPVWQSS